MEMTRLMEMTMVQTNKINLLNFRFLNLNFVTASHCQAFSKYKKVRCHEVVFLECELNECMHRNHIDLKRDKKQARVNN